MKHFAVYKKVIGNEKTLYVVCKTPKKAVVWTNVDGGKSSGPRDILRISIPIISGTKKDKNLDFVPLELPCEIEQDELSLDFKCLFSGYVIVEVLSHLLWKSLAFIAEVIFAK